MHRGMGIASAVFVVVLLGCTSDSKTGQSDPGGSPEAEAKWAKEVAQQFLDAFAAENATGMRAVSTTAHAKEIDNVRITGGPATFTIESHQFSPKLDQATIKGIAAFKGARSTRSFSLLMEKEAERWKVASYTQGPEKKDDEKDRIGIKK